MKPKQQNKVRDMKGVKPGRGSAGRARGKHVEKRAEDAPAGGRFCGFGDVGRACARWLMEHDPEWRRQFNRYEQNEADRLARRVENREREEMA